MPVKYCSTSPEISRLPSSMAIQYFDPARRVRNSPRPPTAQSSSPTSASGGLMMIMATRLNRPNTPPISESTTTSVTCSLTALTTRLRSARSPTWYRRKKLAGSRSIRSHSAICSALPSRTLVRSNAIPRPISNSAAAKATPTSPATSASSRSWSPSGTICPKIELGRQRRDQREQAEQGGERQGSGGVPARPAQREREQRPEADPASGKGPDHGDRDRPEQLRLGLRHGRRPATRRVHQLVAAPPAPGQQGHVTAVDELADERFALPAPPVGGETHPAEPDLGRAGDRGERVGAGQVLGARAAGS